MLKKFIITFILLILTIFSISSPALAVRVNNMDIDIIGSVNESFDDNILSSDKNKKYDFISNFLFGLGLGIQTKTLDFKARTSTTQQVFAINNKYHNNSQDAEISLVTTPTLKDRFELKISFKHLVEPGDFESEFGRSSGRYSYIRNTSGLLYYKDFVNFLSMEILYDNELFYFPKNEFLDSLKNKPAASLLWEVAPKSSITTSYSFAHTFIGKIEKIGTGDETIVHSILPGYRQYFSKLFYMDIKCGPAIIYTSEKEYIKPEARFSLNAELKDTSKYKLNFNYLAEPSPYSQELNESWQISVYIFQEIIKRLFINFNLFYGQGKFVISNIKYTLMGLKLGLRYDIAENFHLKTWYNFRYGDCEDDDNFRYMRHVVFVGCDFIF